MGEFGGSGGNGELGSTATPSSPPGRHGGGSALRKLGFVALVAVVTAAASIVPHAGVGLVVLTPLLRGSGSSLGPTRTALAPPITAVAMSPMLMLLPLLMMTDPVVETRWRCGTALMGALMLLPTMALVAGGVSATAALVLVAFMPKLLRAAGRRLRAPALVLTFALLALGAVRAARRPQPEAWVSSLPVAGSFLGLDANVCTEACDAPPVAFTARGVDHQLLVRCTKRSCATQLADARGVPVGAPSGRDGEIAAGSQAELRVHEGIGVVIVTQGARAVTALDLQTGASRDVALREVAREVAPAPLTLAAGAFGLLIALERTRRAAGERSALQRLNAAIDGRVDDAGIVHPSDGGTSFRPPGGPLPEGPAVILGRPSEGAYRSTPDRSIWVLAGPRLSHLEAHRARAAVFDWEAIAALCLAGAPLYTAALRGLIV